MFNPLTLPSPLGCPLPKGGGLLSSQAVTKCNRLTISWTSAKWSSGYNLSPTELWRTCKDSLPVQPPTGDILLPVEPQLVNPLELDGLAHTLAIIPYRDPEERPE